MAKHVAYPCRIAAIFVIFGINAAKSAENLQPNLTKTSAIFSKYTLESDGMQVQSDGDSSSETDAGVISESYSDDDWLGDELGAESSLGSQDDYEPDYGGYGAHTKRVKSVETIDDSEYRDGAGSIFDQIPYKSSLLSTPPKLKSFGYVEPKNQFSQSDRYQMYSDHLKKWTDSVLTIKPQTADEHRQVFLDSFPTGISPEDIYHALDYGDTGNQHLYAPGATPTKAKNGGTVFSPRRKENVSLLAQGKSPVWIDPRTDQQYRVHMHHIGQENDRTYLVMVPTDIHYSHGMHTATGPSKINRSRFAGERDRGRKALGRKVMPLRLDDGGQ